VVNIASVAAVVAVGPYSASKHAQLAFSRSIAVELRPRGIHVLSVLPGFVETPGFPQYSRFSSRFWRAIVLEPEAVAKRIVSAVERDRREVFVPRYYRIAALAQTFVPGLVARAGKRGIRPSGD
jgi:hypothetical protein